MFNFAPGRNGEMYATVMQKVSSGMAASVYMTNDGGITCILEDTNNSEVSMTNNTQVNKKRGYCISFIFGICLDFFQKQIYMMSSKNEISFHHALKSHHRVLPLPFCRQDLLSLLYKVLFFK